MSSNANTSYPWWKKEVVYQIYPRSFCDSNGDGIGDIPGIISKLDYLKSLGIGIIWLSPVYPSPNADNGYDISDYKNIHPDFGTLADMDALIAGAKERGIKIIMDLVINHTSDEHPWFKAALAGDQKYRGYYIFRPGHPEKKGKKRFPNNWGSFFGGDVWKEVAPNDYYLHLFAEKQPDLNWDNPAVYDEVCDILCFWLDRGIAGFRCDVINIIHKDSLSDGRRRIALQGLEHYLCTEGNHDILRRLRADVLSKYDCFTVGETCFVTPEMGRDLSNSSRGELDMVFFFEHMDVDDIALKWFKVKYRPQKMIRILDKWQKELEWTANYLENHDQPRSLSRFGDPERYRYESATMLAGMNLCLRGTAYVFEGEEIGMTNCPFDGLNDIKDVESHTVDATMKALHFPAKLRRKLIMLGSRDHARTPMQWSAEANAGFTSGEPWLMVNPNYKTVNVALEEERAAAEAAREAAGDGSSAGTATGVGSVRGAGERSILRFYRELIALRNTTPALTEGSYARLSAPKGVYAFERVLDGTGTALDAGAIDSAAGAALGAGVTNGTAETALGAGAASGKQHAGAGDFGKQGAARLVAVCNMTGKPQKYAVEEGTLLLGNYHEPPVDGTLRPYEFMLVQVH